MTEPVGQNSEGEYCIGNRCSIFSDTSGCGFQGSVYCAGGDGTEITHEPVQRGEPCLHPAMIEGGEPSQAVKEIDLRVAALNLAAIL